MIYVNSSEGKMLFSHKSGNSVMFWIEKVISAGCLFADHESNNSNSYIVYIEPNGLVISETSLASFF